MVRSHTMRAYEQMGVAISTTGDEHRMGFLETCVAAWREALPLGSIIVVTVDGTEEDAQRAKQVVDGSARDGHVGGTTYRVGQPTPLWKGPGVRNGRLGVAANKNTGLELLMDAGASDPDGPGYPTVEHLFLCDDDTWPLAPQALTAHTTLSSAHSLVCWGKSRLLGVKGPVSTGLAEWTWPRGVLLYARREVVVRVGGMVEEFGIGGHEHVEWSERIHAAGLTPAPFVSPASYGVQDAQGSRRLWHAEDQPQEDDSPGEAESRKRRNTTIRRKRADWVRIDKIMAARQGSAAFVPFGSHGNGRESATLC